MKPFGHLGALLVGLGALLTGGVQGSGRRRAGRMKAGTPPRPFHGGRVLAAQRRRGFWLPRAGWKGERSSPDRLTHLRWRAERTGGKHAVRAWLCAEHSVPNTPRQWRKLMRRLRAEEQ